MVVLLCCCGCAGAGAPAPPCSTCSQFFLAPQTFFVPHTGPPAAGAGTGAVASAGTAVGGGAEGVAGGWGADNDAVGGTVAVVPTDSVAAPVLGAAVAAGSAAAPVPRAAVVATTEPGAPPLHAAAAAAVVVGAATADFLPQAEAGLAGTALRATSLPPPRRSGNRFADDSCGAGARATDGTSSALGLAGSLNW